ncbi:MAG: LysR family transcriptional regulator [Acidovorax sp.]|jgi:DNA-binding transcriptional LysR family regulator|nr:LysR family transcriptional regulator [Acidovorax sp.]
MDFRQLRQFVVLASELNFRKAAERLHMTQPPLSIAIKRLEEDLEVKLFERDRQGVRLTPAGMVFLGEAQRLIEGADNAVKATQDADKGQIGTLRVSVVPSASLELLPDILERFALRFPSIRLRLSSGSSVSSVGEVQRGEIDAALLVPPAFGLPSVAFFPLCKPRLVLALASSHPMAQAGTVRLSQLQGEPLVSLAHSDSPGFAGEIMRLCQLEGLAPKALYESSHALITLPLVAAGQGIAIVPESYRRIQLDKLRYLELTDSAGEPLRYPIAMAAQEHCSNPAVRWLVEVAQQVLGQASLATPSATPPAPPQR